ncbi:MAG: ABC transporter permease [Chloroflexi bacterium]|nr:ABC transporter permease [Chloroflexota bacterium]
MPRAPSLPHALPLVAAAALLSLIVLPLAAIAVRGAPEFAAAVGAAEVRSAVALTAWTSAIALLVILLIGTPTAWLVARHRSRGWRIIDALLDLPVVLPPSVAGLGLLMAFGRTGLIGPVLNTLGIPLAFSTAAVIIAQVFVAAPLYVRAAIVGFRSVDRDLERVAMVEGAGAWQIFRFITLPLALPALMAGAVTAWARSLGEFGATILFAGNLVGRTQTMALAIYTSFQSDLPAALALTLLLLLASLTVLVTARLLRTADASS